MSKSENRITVLFFNLFTWLGGGELSIYQLVKNLDRTRFRPIMLFNKKGPLTDKTETEGIESVIIPFVVSQPKDLLRPSNIRKNIRASIQIVRLIKNQKVDVVHCCDVYSILLLLPSIIRLRVPIVFNVIVFYSILRYWFFNLLSIFFVGRIVTNSEAVKEDLLKKTIGLRKQTSVIHNGVDPSIFFPRSKEEIEKTISKLGLSKDKKIIGLVGRYEVWKGHLTFIDAVDRILKTRDDVCFLIVGGAITSEVAPEVAHYRQKVIERINQLNLRTHITMLDHRDDVPEIMASLDVFVCPSDYEPYGLVVLEAYASGVPIVVSRTVGALDVLSSWPGVFIAEPRNAESFIIQINNALSFDRKILRDKSGQKKTDLISWRSYTYAFEVLYEAVR